MKKVLLAVVMSIFAMSAFAQQTVKVPNINGQCGAAPANILKKNGLKAKAKAIYGPEDQDAVEMGCAYRQNPKAGTVVKKGTAVTYRYWYES